MDTGQDTYGKPHVESEWLHEWKRQGNDSMGLGSLSSEQYIWKVSKTWHIQLLQLLSMFS